VKTEEVVDGERAVVAFQVGNCIFGPEEHAFHAEDNEALTCGFFASRLKNL
jgi:hypothetical protein